MKKLDLVKENKDYYTAAAEPKLVEISKAQFISITGVGDPSGEAFQKNIEAIYATAYRLKFAAKANGTDFGVPKLEGQWWFDEKRYGTPDMVNAPTTIPRSAWEYRLLLRMPEFVTAHEVDEMKAIVAREKNNGQAERVQLFKMEEGLCVQALHVGPFADEPKTLSIMLDFMRGHKLGKNGLHHEIYLSDFRKTAPSKLKTILREPVISLESVRKEDRNLLRRDVRGNRSQAGKSQGAGSVNDVGLRWGGDVLR